MDFAFWRAGFLAAFLSFGAALMAGQAGAGSAVCDLSGKVLDADTREPIARVRVKVEWNGPNEHRETTVLTDGAGMFRVANVPVGDVATTVERSGYLDGGGAPGVDLRGKSGVVEVTRYLRKQAVIEGRVTNDSGTGLRAWVTVFRLQVVDGVWAPVLAASAGADSDGEFRASGLKAGRYYVAASVAAAVGRLGYPARFYPDATTLEGAQLLELRPGSEEHLDIRMSGQPAREVRGRLAMDSDGISCALTPLLDTILLTQTGHSCSVKAGEFAIQGVSPGTYLLQAFWAGDGRSHTAMENITVGGNTGGIVLTAPVSRQLRGTVVQDLAATPGQVIQLESRFTPTSANLEPDGTFNTPEIAPGIYRVRMFGAGTQCVNSIRQGGRDALRDGILIANENPEPVEIVVSHRCGRVEGTVAGPNVDARKPMVVGWFRRLDGKLMFDSQAFVQPYGRGGELRFGSRAMAAGEYVVFAWQSSSGQAYQLPYATEDFMRQYGTRGESVWVQGEGKVSVTLHDVLPIEAFDRN